MENAICPGFRSGGIAAGIKKNGEKDLGLIFSRRRAAAAGLFTRNRVQAAPVTLDRERIQPGICRAVIVNSGNANCCTGAQGLTDAASMTAMAAAQLGVPEQEVLVASTGVIGEPMPMDKVGKALPELAGRLSETGFVDFARSIMTTDTVPKLAVRQERFENRVVTVIASAKGAGMIRPDMATMLCFVCTDAQLKPETLQMILTRAADRSFNRMTIDGDTSTNDTVLALANGFSGVCMDGSPERERFQGVLDGMFTDLSRQLVRDGEGVTKVVEIVVRGAESVAAAENVADAVAHSNLVKTAFFGEDANWGRIMGAVGRAGVPVMPQRIDLFFDHVQMVRNGLGCGPAAEKRATEVLKKPEFVVTIDLNDGSGRATMLTCDFSVAYVRINADYRS